MIEHSQLIAYALSKRGAYIDYPFGEYPVCVKVMNKLFYQGYDTDKFNMITLKCDRDLSVILRNKYHNIVVRGYHCPEVQQPFWNTIHLDNDIVPQAELFKMIDHAYDVVVAKLSAKDRQTLNEKGVSDE